MKRSAPIRLALLACLGLCLPAAAAGSEQKEGGFVGQVALGYRSVDVGGSENKYREDVNLGDGPLLYHLSFNLVPEGSVRSAVDEIWADLNDVGGQPFETYRFGFRKHGAYTFTYDRQESDYFYNDTLLADGAAVPDPETWDVRRVRQRAKLGLELNPRSSLTFGFETLRRDGGNTGTPRLRSGVFALSREVAEQLDTFWGNFQYSWEKVTLVFEKRIQDFENPMAWFIPGQVEVGNEITDFVDYDTTYSWSGDEYIVRLLATPNPDFDIRAVLDFQELELDTVLTEMWDGTSSGVPVSQDLSGSGEVEREIVLGEIELSYRITDRWGVVGGVRRHDLDQDGSSELGTTVNSGDWSIETQGIEAGARFLATREVTLGFGLMYEDREVQARRVEDADARLRDVSTSNIGFFADLVWRPSARGQVTAKADLNSIDDPYTTASATDRQRLRVRGRYRWNNGVYGTASYTFNNFENDDSGWTSDSSHGEIRAGCRRSKVDVSAGLSRGELERSIVPVINGTNPRPIGYDSDADFVTAQLRWFATRGLTLTGAVYLYDNTGTLDLERTDSRIALEYAFARGAMVGLAYRTIDYEQRDLPANDYDADVVDYSIGYRW
jgi:hypothetical protein